MYFLIITFSLTFFIGIFYGKKLAPKGVNIDNLFNDNFRKIIFINIIICIFVLLLIAMKYPYILPYYLQLVLDEILFNLIKAILIFFVGLTVSLTKKSEKQKTFSVIFIAIFSFFIIQKVENFLYKPIYLEIKKERIAKDGSILQTTDATCTPAALANILKSLKISTNEKECARILNTTQFGTTQSKLIKGLRKFGLYGYLVNSDSNNLKRINRQLISSVWFAGIRHSIVFKGTDKNGNFITINPITGIEKLSPKIFNKNLADSFAVVIVRNPVINIDADSPVMYIEQIQNILKSEKYLDKISGIYDIETIHAVKRFQKKYFLKQNGIIDAETLLLLTGPYTDLGKIRP